MFRSIAIRVSYFGMLVCKISNFQSSIFSIVFDIIHSLYIYIRRLFILIWKHFILYSLHLNTNRMPIREIKLFARFAVHMEKITTWLLGLFFAPLLSQKDSCVKTFLFNDRFTSTYKVIFYYTAKICTLYFINAVPYFHYQWIFSEVGQEWSLPNVLLLKDILLIFT